MFEVIVALASTAAGAVAAVAGFGIGSILTPLFALQFGTKLAVAAVSIPHVLATLVRLWLLRREVDRQVLLTFGVVSAAGGLTGAILQSSVSNPALSVIFAALLLFAGITEFLGLTHQLRFGRITVMIAGAISGLLGGLVGNQGGIRSAALLAFDLNPRAFVATATSIALLVDIARLPVYLIMRGAELPEILGLIGLASAAAVIGTLFGEQWLRRVTQVLFRRLVALLIAALGVAMLFQAAGK